MRLIEKQLSLVKQIQVVPHPAASIRRLNRRTRPARTYLAFPSGRAYKVLQCSLKAGVWTFGEQQDNPASCPGVPCCWWCQKLPPRSFLDTHHGGYSYAAQHSAWFTRYLRRIALMHLCIRYLMGITAVWETSRNGRFPIPPGR